MTGLADYHMHTRSSCDSQATMAAMGEASCQAGLAEIGFSDHFDNAPRDSGYGFFKLEPWAAELAACRQQFAGRLTVRAGLEIGEPHVYPAEVRAILARYPFDYVIGSLHWVGPDFAFVPEFFQRPADEAYGCYYEELERMTRLGDFDILGHIEGVARVGYTVYTAHDPARYEEVIRAALRNCVERGIALDVNTWSVRRGNQCLTPSPQILRWYRALGGERVTLGSDAHEPARVAEDFDVALAALREAGLRYVTRFERRQAVLLPLP